MFKVYKHDTILGMVLEVLLLVGYITPILGCHLTLETNFNQGIELDSRRRKCLYAIDLFTYLKFGSLILGYPGLSQGYLEDVTSDVAFSFGISS